MPNEMPDEERINASTSGAIDEQLMTTANDNDPPDNPKPVVKPTTETDSDTGDPKPPPSSFAETVYKQICAVIGDNGPHQFLCLTIPGQVLSPEDFAYDYKNNAPKGPTVEANESRLVNKLFDPSRMTGADNGLTLPYQYRAALDMLSPKLNLKVAKAKNQLRQLLMTPYPYDFGDGEQTELTLQDVFFRLYDAWVAEGEKWAGIQNAKREELRRRFPGTDAKSNTQFNDAYLEWYETVAESYLNAINEKMSKVISVFTPNDMKILEGILDSGSGAELQEARQTLTNTRKLTPDGGYVYPVKLNPTNWFEMLDTAFTPVDLLKTPDVLSVQLQSLSTRRLYLSARIAEIAAMVPDAKAVADAQNEVGEAKTDLDAAKNSLVTEYGAGFSTLVDTVFDIVPLFVGGVPADIVKKLSTGLTFPSGKTISTLVSSITTALTKGLDTQQKYINAAQALAKAMETAIEGKNLLQLKTLLAPLKAQLDKIDMDIKDIQTQIQISVIVHPTPDKDTGLVKDTATGVESVTPPLVPTGFNQIVITAEASALDSKTSTVSTASASSWGANFLFGGYSTQSSSSSSSYKSYTDQKDTSIQIGMNIAKVGIEREWFNPGVFALTKDMFNVTTQKIAPEPAVPYTEINDERLREMAKNYVFPCYPVAMLIARDISIKLLSSDSISSAFAESVEKHASSGGGFLFFSGSASSSSSSSESGVHTKTTANSVTLKFDTPQIIGYYLEATPSDKSVYLDDVGDDERAGYVPITTFVSEYKKILEEMRKAKQPIEKRS